eukprot:jgi/Bigna1/144265/aug1.85_g18973
MIKGHDEKRRIPFFDNTRRFILQRAKQSIDYNKKKMNEYINGKSLPNILPPDTPTGAFNRLHIQSLHSAMPIDSNSAYATTKRGSGRYYNNIFKNMLENKRQFFAERDALKQGLSMVKEDDEKPATEKESIFKGESVYVKMLNQVVDLFEEGDYSEIKLTYLRNAYSQLKKEYNTIKKDDVVKYAKFIASVVKYHFEGNKTFTRNVKGKQLRVTAKSFPKSKLMVFFKILNLSVIILGNKNKSDEELKIVIEGSSKMLNAPKTPQAGRDLFNDLKSKYNVSIPTIDLTNTIEASLGAEVDKSIRDKEINSVATELRSTATTGRQIDKDIVDKYQKAIDSAFTGSNNLDEVKTGERKDLLDNKKYKLDKIPKNTMIKVFNKNVRVGAFINNLRASLKKTDTERDTKNKVSLILNDVESKKNSGNLTLKYMKQVQKEINKNFKDLNPKNKFTYDGKSIDKNDVKKVIQAEVDSFGKSERKERNAIESNLLKVEKAYSDDDSVLPEAKTAINLLKKKKQNEKYRFFNEVLTASQLIKVLQELVDDEDDLDAIPEPDD